MPRLIERPTRVPAAGTPPKRIDEYVGGPTTGTDALSIAHMRSPEGWKEPGQRPDFDEYTLVLHGRLVVEYEGGQLEVSSGQAVITSRGEWVRYHTPDPEGAEYIAVCLPAFTPTRAHRDEP